MGDSQDLLKLSLRQNNLRDDGPRHPVVKCAERYHSSADFQPRNIVGPATTI